jgi:hypothetical protein
MKTNTDDIVYRLIKRAEIRREIPTRKSVQNNEPDRIADLLEEAASEISLLRNLLKIEREDRFNENAGLNIFGE